jgi:predicted nucleic acid-binding Zn ribbon protein|tara:strand:- start:1288 stop:1563 length:276 start_codon:yes stop_codon:yes gene_type:complete
MRTLKTALNIFLTKSGLDKGVKQERAVLVWKEAVGDLIAENAVAEKAEHGTLFVRVSTPTWRQELQLKKSEILEKVNKKAGFGAIKDIKFI